MKTFTVVGIHPIGTGSCTRDDAFVDCVDVRDDGTDEADQIADAVDEARRAASPEDPDSIEILAVFRGEHHDIYDCT